MMRPATGNLLETADGRVVNPPPACADCAHPAAQLESHPHAVFLNNVLEVRCSACRRMWELRSGAYTLIGTTRPKVMCPEPPLNGYHTKRL